MGLLSRRTPAPERSDDPIVLPDPPAGHQDGYPDDCPACGGGAYLDRIDITSRRQWQHCRSCGHRWKTPID